MMCRISVGRSGSAYGSNTNAGPLNSLARATFTGRVVCAASPRAVATRGGVTRGGTGRPFVVFLPLSGSTSITAAFVPVTGAPDSTARPPDRPAAGGKGEGDGDGTGNGVEAPAALVVPLFDAGPELSHRMDDSVKVTMTMAAAAANPAARPAGHAGHQARALAVRRA